MYKLSIIKNPAGTYSYVGNIPTVLGNEVPATVDDVRGQRWHKNHHGDTMTWKFPVFATEQDAIDHAASRGITI
ncbi:MAG: hypothetical protein ACW99U_21755 [Candidatus Thorarchaeota archaeon]|jgi:hypothetical protein